MPRGVWLTSANSDSCHGCGLVCFDLQRRLQPADQVIDVHLDGRANARGELRRAHRSARA